MSNAVATQDRPKAPSPMTAFRTGMDRMDAEIRAVLPKHIAVEQFKRVVLTAVQMNPKLLDCTPKSLYGAALACAKDGLLPDGREAALVQFKDTCQYMPMVRGLIKLARQSGEIATISANIVYEKDEFVLDMASGERPIHRPYLDGDPGKFRLAYALASFKDGTFQIERMTKDQIEKVRAVSRAKNNGPWSDWWDEMARKTVLRRLMKYLSLSPELHRALEQDDAFYDLQAQRAAVKATLPKTLGDDFAALPAPEEAPQEAQDGDDDGGQDDAPATDEADPEPPEADQDVPAWTSEDQAVALAEIGEATTLAKLEACKPYVRHAREAGSPHAADALVDAIKARKAEIEQAVRS